MYIVNISAYFTNKALLCVSRQVYLLYFKIKFNLISFTFLKAFYSKEWPQISFKHIRFIENLYLIVCILYIYLEKYSFLWRCTIELLLGVFFLKSFTFHMFTLFCAFTLTWPKHPDSFFCLIWKDFKLEISSHLSYLCVYFCFFCVPYVFLRRIFVHLSKKNIEK